MGETSKIQWTDSTANPWRGCTKVSEGCQFCYAERLASRNPAVLGEWGPQGTRVLAAESTWRQFERWNRDTPEGSRNLVFCASLADVFEDWPGQMTDCLGAQLVQEDGSPYLLASARVRLWQVIRRTPRLIWQVLTKRPQNIARMMPHGPWENVWLGTSIESQEWSDRCGELVDAGTAIMGPVRFLSAEPLLGPLDVRRWLHPNGINWVIIGGESGGRSRPMQIDWARDLIAQCKEAHIPCFVKQMGRMALDGKVRLPLVHDSSHGGDPEDWPEDLNVREIPD